MADKRIKALTAASTLAATDVFAMDNNTITEAQKVSCQQLATFLASLMFRTTSTVIAAGANAVVFPTVMSAATYKVFYNAYTASGEQFLGGVSAKTVNGFTFTSPIAGTLEYFCVL